MIEYGVKSLINMSRAKDLRLKKGSHMIGFLVISSGQWKATYFMRCLGESTD